MAYKFIVSIFFICCFTLNVFAQIPTANLKLWFRADSNVVLNGGNVSQWKDCSGNNFHAVQNTNANQPLLISNSLNNLPIIRFDGVNDNMLSDVLISDDKLTVFLICKNSSTVNNAGLLSLYNTSNDHDWNNSNSIMTLIINNSNFISYRNGMDVLYSSINYSFSLFGLVCNGVIMKTFFNSLPISYNNSSGNFNINKAVIGSRYTSSMFNHFMSVDLAEIIVYNAVLSSSDKLNVENYLMNKYAPPVSLGNDTIIDYSLCSYELGVSSEYNSVLWSTGSTDDSISVDRTGTYWVQVTDVFGRGSSDTINVQFPHLMFVNTTVCLGDTAVYVNSLLGDYDYEWSDASTDSVLKITEAGTYWLKIIDTLGCILSDTFVVAVDSFSVRASLGPDVSVCSGESLGLLVGAAQAVDYVWSNSETTPEIVLHAPGEYSVTVANALGCVALDTINVTFHGYKPSVGFVSDSVCFGSPTTFVDTSFAASPDAIALWQWSIDGNVFGTQNPQYQFPDPGLHQVQLSVSTDSGCTASIVQNVFVMPNPQADFMPMTGCTEKIIQFNNLTTIPWGSVLAWEWQAVDTNDIVVDNSTATHPSFNFDQAMTYNVSLAVVTTDGCRDSVIKPVVIRQTPLVDFEWSNTCIGYTTSFVETTQVLPQEAIIQRQWDFGDDGVSSLPNPLHLFDEPGTYQVSLYNKSINGCSDTVIKPVTIYKLPIVGFENTIPCLNTTVHFFDTSHVENGTIAQVLWTFPGGDTTSVWNPLYNFPDTGAYSIQLQAISDQGCIRSMAKVIQVYPFPDANFSLSPEYGIAPLEVSFFNESTGALVWMWDFGDDTYSTLQNPSHTYMQTDVYTVTLIAMNDYMCSDEVLRTVYVIPSTYDIAVTDVEQVSSGGMITSVVKVRNYGNRFVRSLRMILQVDNGMPITELWEGVLAPGEEMVFTFNSLLQESALSGRKMICYSALPNEEVEDLNISNNTWCHIMDPGFYIMSVSPNPAGDEVFIDFVMKAAENFGVQLTSTDGRIVQDSQLQEGNEGMNRLRIDLTPFNQGVYSVRIYTDTEQLIDKIVIAK